MEHRQVDRAMAIVRNLPRLYLPVALAVLWTSPGRSEGDVPPNVLVFLVDDMGFTDSSTYGSEYYETPNLDRLAAAGVRFTNAYAACNVCSPTRASLLTGKTPARLHLTDWISGWGDQGKPLGEPAWTRQLRLDQVTIAEALRSRGYATGFIGKWHLGERNRAEADPTAQGFDSNVGGDHRGSPNSATGSHFADAGGSFGLPGLGPGSSAPGEYLTDRLTRAAREFLRDRAGGAAPFFLLVSHYAVHTPIQAKPDLIEKYRNKPPTARHDNPTYAAMVESVDQSLGAILDALGDPNDDGDPADSVASDTVVFFLSDNGGLEGPTDNWPLRAGKGTNYEGGVRTPFVVSGVPGMEAGTISSAPVATYDVFPTILELTGTDPPEGVIDGVSILPVLLGQNVPERSIPFHYPHYHIEGATPHSVIRRGDWRLLMHHETGAIELFHLEEDPGESQDRSPEQAELVADLRSELESYLAEVDAQYPLGSRFLRPPRHPDGQGTISVNLGTGPSTTLAPEEFAGVIEENHWNNAISPGRQSGSGRVDPLLDADGAATPASFEFQAGYMFDNSNSGSGDYRMMNGWGGNKASDAGNKYSLRGLPERFTFAGYDLYVYYDSDFDGDRAREMSFRIGETTLFARELPRDYYGLFVEADTSGATSFAEAQPGNYVVFRDLRSPDVDLVVDAAGGVRGTVNGIQIVARPVTPASFLRGDADASGEHDATDAVSILEYLFLGGATPSCLASADANTSGDIDISDPVFLLLWLFAGGEAPAPPFPSCGRAPGGPLSCFRHPPCNPE